jgi:pimeloyl-ACP methyl ester carboxylesterase
VRRIYFLLTPICLLMISSCATWPGFWTTEERGAQIRGSITSNGNDLIEASISVPLNPYNTLDGRFDLYYFVHKASVGNSRKTVLFVAGGPGEFVMPATANFTFANFLALNEYNVVFFHLRGAGFSQIPPQSQYDKFLTTSYAVEDIEEIRQDLIRQKLLNDEGKWDAIIAWSYGTVLAQQYTFAHQNSVDKLILFAPLSRHNVASSARQFRDQTQNILRDNLDKIYSPPVTYDPRTPDRRQKEFSDLTEEQKKQIFYTVFGGIDDRGIFAPGVIETTESAFGSINFVVDQYSKLKKGGELHRYNLAQYSCSFFEKLYQLRFYGWIGNSVAVDNQLEIGAKIRDEIIHPMNVGKDDCSNAVPSSTRVFYAMGALDGINIRFLREWLANGRRDVRDALRKSAGDAHVKRGVNEYVEKLGIDDDDMIEPSSDGAGFGPPWKTEWDPARYKHRRPTLILKGEADPVTVAGQAEYFHSEALLGPRVLITFSGIGHFFELPETQFQQTLSGMIKLDANRLSPGQIAEVRGTINGLKLNRNLNLRLLPPHDLEASLRLVGFGRVAGDAPNGTGDDIVALIKNTGWNEVRGSRRVWKLDSEFFSGKVEIDVGILAAGETKVIYGKIIDPRQNEAYRVRVRPPNDWDVNIKVLCTQLDGSTVETMLLNQGNSSTEGKMGRWTLYNDYFSTDFVASRFSQILAPGDIINRSTELSNQQAERLPDEARWTFERFEACAPRREDLSRALAQEVHCDLPIIVHHSPTASSSEETEKHWKIEKRAFTATISSRFESCMPDGNPRIVKGVATLKLKDWVVVREPSGSEDDFDLLGYNILDDGRISLVLRNRDQFNSKPVGEKGRDWSYSLVAYPPATEPCNNRLATRNTTRECLIYSYLVMDPIQFNAIESSEMFDDICKRFKKENGAPPVGQKCPGIHVDPLSGGVLLPAR